MSKVDQNATTNNARASDLAKACAKVMQVSDAYSHALGIRLAQIEQGLAVMIMAVDNGKLNGYGTCHGGVIFSLADTAFAYACNSQNQTAVAASCTIDFVRPAKSGDVLTATATMQYQGRRTGVYQTLIVNQDEKLIAIFKGNAARLGTPILDPSLEESL